MHRRRTTIAAASLLLSLVVGACSAPAGDGEQAAELGPSRSAPAVEAPSPDVVPDPAAGAAAPAPRSALADLVEPAGSAVYDPMEHERPARTVTRLSVPAIDVDAPVRPVGVEANGEMEIPPADEVGWYRFGAGPGDPGSSVLVAHVAYDGVDGAFRHLDRVRAGDEVVVGFDDGSALRYRVTELATYRKDALPEDVFSRQVPERLVLITCGGAFDPSLRSYESNVVAYAVPA